MKFRNIPWMFILQLTAVAVATIETARRFGQWRKDRINAGETDPMPWAIDIPGGTATVWAGLILLGTTFLIKGKKNRTFGYVATAVALRPAGQSLLATTGLMDHVGPTPQALIDAQSGYDRAAANLLHPVPAEGRDSSSLSLLA